MIVRSMEKTLELVEPHVPPTLVSPRDWRAFGRCAPALLDAASVLTLECHLGATASRIDFLACVLAEGREILASRLPRSRREGPVAPGGLPPPEGADLLRGPPGRLLAAWTTPGTLLFEQVPLLWFEFDQPAARRGPVEPSVLLCLDPRPLTNLEAPEAERDFSPSGRLRLVEAALSVLLDGPVPAATQAALLRCFTLLPDGGHVVHLSVMSARQPATLKLNVSLPRDRLTGYLLGVGWPGNPGEVEELLETLRVEDERVTIDVTLGDSVAPRLGIELFDLATRKLDPGRSATLERLSSLGLCTPSQRDALAAWPGSSRERCQEGEWPSRVRRWIDLKIVLGPDRALSAKAYLGVLRCFSLA
ncbi:hypothetical protein WME97_31415 [Sorangium sp. So ce367]|uniref:hypothetical protein n=1 Tax=Sorangium sp. So ce367 TaxID=3133305 RepID=UPI003F637028